MSDRSAIEWTDATWNPVTGCTEVSPGCDRCYARTFAERWRGIPGHHFEAGWLADHAADVPVPADGGRQPDETTTPTAALPETATDRPTVGGGPC